MLRYSLLVLAACLAITTAASAQITFSIGGGNNRNCPPPQYNNGGYYNNGNYNNQGYQYGNRGYQYRPAQNCNQQVRQPKRRGKWARQANNRQCAPAGHYYCQHHRSYCSH